MNIEDRILQRIREEGIQPVPRWLAILPRILRAVAAASSLALSAILCDIAFDLLSGDSGPHRGFRLVLRGLVPWIALSAALLLSWTGWRLYRKAGTGYRRRAATVVAAFFGISLAGGWTLHSTDSLFAVHRLAARNFPAYRAFFREQRDRAFLERGFHRAPGRGCGRNDSLHAPFSPEVRP